MTVIPKSHPRAESLRAREKLVRGFELGMVATEGLLAQGRGEAFDYLLGEKTTRQSRAATRAAAALLLLADSPVISVNGNAAALCPREIAALQQATGAKVEVNLFYGGEKRRRLVAAALRRGGARNILGTDKRNLRRLSGTDSARRMVDAGGIFAADVVVVPLEDGDRTAALRSAGKKVIAFDLNPLSRTAQTADITIVDNITRAVAHLAGACQKTAGRSPASLGGVLDRYDNKKTLAECIGQIKSHLARRMRVA